MNNRKISLDALNSLGRNTLSENLGIVLTEIGEDYVKATMPVDHRTVQPFGILHGGASVVLAETLGSMASVFFIDTKTQSAVGLEINANHIKSAKAGEVVTGTAKALHIGRKTQIWEIKITNQAEQLVCISRLTIAVIDRK
jgi:1,4-dihydroxy-2-naphthoyl-CoA hydrolase